MVSADAIIRTVGLTKRYVAPNGQSAARPAVDQLDLEVPHGEIFGLLGPNGAGQDDDDRHAHDAVIPTAGEAWVGGIDVVADPARAKQLIGVVTQTNTLDRSLTVYENLYFHGRYFGMSAKEAKSEAQRLLEQFHLADRASAEVVALSGGMAQRLMVARSIMHRPAVLFLDEPTAGLDPQSRLSLWEAVHELNAAGQTILLTTHYMEEADQLCQRVAIMDHGQILALDTPSELKRSVDADTVVTVHASGDPEVLVSVLTEVEGVSGASSAAGAVLVNLRGGGRGSVATDPDGRRRRGHRRRRCVDRRADARDRVHQPHRKGVARLMTATLSEARPTMEAARSAFFALLMRDITVVRKELRMFIGRTIMQPLLLLFVFTYVFPRIGQDVGGKQGAAAFSTLLTAGVIGSAMIFQGIQAVALPLVQDFGYTREIEDRVLAPLPVWAVAFEKVVQGAIQAMLAALVVFPLALFVPATTVHLRINVLVLLTLLPLGSVMSAAARAGDRNARGAAAGAAGVQPARHPDDVPRLRVLPVGKSRADQVAQDRRAHQPARVPQRRAPRLRSHRRAT